MRRLHFQRAAAGHDPEQRQHRQLPPQRRWHVLYGHGVRSGWPHDGARRLPVQRSAVRSKHSRVRRQPQGEFAGLPVFVRAPNGYIKENNLYAWASSPLERLSSFANGHFDISDSVRVTAQAWSAARRRESSLGLTAANINQWAAAVPFGNEIYRGNNQPLYPGSRAGPQYLRHSGFARSTRTGTACRMHASIRTQFRVHDQRPFRRRVRCATHAGNALARRPARLHDVGGLADQPRGLQPLHEPAGSEPGHLGQPFARLPEDDARQWPLDDQHDDDDEFSLGLEGDLPSGDDLWDITVSTGRSDNVVNQLGSVRLSSYRVCIWSPNYGRGCVFDPNPSTPAASPRVSPTCTSGLPIADDSSATEDCVQMLSPSSEERARDGRRRSSRPTSSATSPRCRPARCSMRSV